MTIAQCGNELKYFLQQKPKECRVVVLPDFFLDRLINLKWNYEEFSNLIAEVAERKGGSIDGVPQTDLRGGNAINVTSALSKLGAIVTPIICTSEYGLQQIKYYFEDTQIDTSHIKIRDKASITTALEFQNGNQKTNVMIRDLGSLEDFGPNDLNEDDFGLIEASDYTCLFNWAGTLKFGTTLAQSVFGRTKSKDKSKTYFDTADPTPNRIKIGELIQTLLKSDQVDILSVNENEAITYASLLDKKFDSRKDVLSFAELAMEAARVLSRRLTSRIDLHTTFFSASLKGKKEVMAPTFKVNVLRSTGAGDAWTAGNIIGDRNGLSDECRLMLANAVAACYLSDADGKHPSWTKLSIFLRDNTLPDM
ncbi:MAG TPA: carbohydrate kinase family protein [Candidatus Acidoferrum sp.]|nr:carbohydrate kinase family protein [Candidatus Acidoferrum sp.]